MKPGTLFSKKAGGAAGPPHDAATLLLLRDRDRGGFELLLMRRHRDQSFMGGAFVFPGGRLEEADAAPELSRFSGGFGEADAQRRLQEPGLSGAVALGLFMAAIRETFEEAGVLLARDASGRAVDLTNPDRAARFARYRVDLHDGRLLLADLAQQEGLRFWPELLLPYAHWITPEAEARRFDTRFFLARLPAGQLPSHDRLELTESRWLTPAEALADHEAGRIVLMPPTLKTIAELQAYAAIDPLFVAARARRLGPILPDPVQGPDGLALLLPWDPRYSLRDKEPPRPGEATRIVLQDGIWRLR